MNDVEVVENIAAVKDQENVFKEVSKFREGPEIVFYLSSLQTGTGKYTKSLTYNRVVKEVATLRDALDRPVVNLPANVNKWNSLSHPEQESVIEFIRKLSIDEESRENFIAVIAAIIDNKRKSAAVQKGLEIGNMILQRKALMAHTVIHSKLVDDMTELLGGVNDDAVIRTMTNEGIKKWKQDKIIVICQKGNSIVKNEVCNIFSSVDIVAHIKPEDGLLEPTSFWEEYSEMKNNMDTLYSKLEVSGRNENGDILDTTAWNFINNGGNSATINAALFYVYLVWKGQDMGFTSNRMEESACRAAGIGVTPEYVREKNNRSTPSTNSSAESKKPSKRAKLDNQFADLSKLFTEDFNFTTSKILLNKIKNCNMALQLGLNVYTQEQLDEYKANAMKFGEELNKL